MSSYHSNFTYLNKNSKDDYGWIIVHFDPDNGEMDSYLSQEQIYTDSYNGSKRILYGTKWNTTAIIKITVIKQNGNSFSLEECRNAYRWLTGNPNASWLDLYSGGSLKYSFMCTVQDVKPQKLDARTVGLNIYFESVSPWAYSPEIPITHKTNQGATISEDGTLSCVGTSNPLAIIDDGILYGTNKELLLTKDGIVDLNGMLTMTIDNKTDDLYSYVYLDTKLTNTTGSYISIKNITLNEETTITGIGDKEIITLSSGQFILSDKPNKIFGNTFNFVWPRLAPGRNEFVIDCPGVCDINFTYRYPIKIGDCAIDIDVSEGDLCCGGDASNGVTSGSVSWHDVTDTPTTIEGYGITNAYNKFEVDNKVNGIGASVNKQELNDMLTSILGT